MSLAGRGGIYIGWPFGRSGSRVRECANEPDPTVDFGCMGDYSKEEFTIHLPKDVKVRAMPRNVEIKGKYQTYKATYELKGNTITAARGKEDHKPRAGSAPAGEAGSKKIATSVEAETRPPPLFSW